MRIRTKPILVVEDDEDTRSFLRLTLSDWGHTVVCAEDGREAMAVARQIVPLAVILDLWLPHVSGFEFRSWLLEQRHLARVPVIVLTAAGPAAADPVPEVATLYKPVDVDLLKALLDVQLAGEHEPAAVSARTPKAARR